MKVGVGRTAARYKMSTQTPAQTATFHDPQGRTTRKIGPRYRLSATRASPIAVTAKTFILTRYNSWPHSNQARRLPTVRTKVVPLKEFQNVAMRAMIVAEMITR